MAVIVHNLAADAYGLQTCQLAQINSGFGVTGTHQYTALACTQRENVTGTAEVARLCTGLSAFFMVYARSYAEIPVVVSTWSIETEKAVS